MHADVALLIKYNFHRGARRRNARNNAAIEERQPYPYGCGLRFIVRGCWRSHGAKYPESA
jgi:hypothetical protein